MNDLLLIGCLVLVGVAPTMYTDEPKEQIKDGATVQITTVDEQYHGFTIKYVDPYEYCQRPSKF